MAILSAMINAMSCYEPEMMEIEDETTLERAAARIISKVRTVAAASYKMSIGQPLMYPHPEFSYCNNFLHMMFSISLIGIMCRIGNHPRPFAVFDPARRS
jgi:citrate synthase